MVALEKKRPARETTIAYNCTPRSLGVKPDVELEIKNDEGVMLRGWINSYSE
jgi:hypothetical protein